MTTDSPQTDQSIKQFEEASAHNYRRNFAAGLVHGTFFQMSAAFTNIQTVLPSFVSLLTPAATAVGLMATIQEVGRIIPQLFTAYFLEDKPRQKPYLLGVITIRWISLGLLAWTTYRYAATNPMLVLGLLVTLFGLFSLAGGAGTVLYASIFSRAIPANRRGRFVGMRQLIGFALAIAAGWIVRGILADPVRFPFALNYSLIFLFSTVALAIAFFGFAMIKEPIYPVKRHSASLGAKLREAMFLTRRNANFRTLLYSRMIFGVAFGFAPFYVVYARTELNVDPAMVGVFLAAQMAGAAVSNLLWGWLADNYGNKPVILGTTLSGLLTPILALLVPMSVPTLYVFVFVLIGAMLSGMRIGYENIILEMANPAMRGTCVALQNTLLTPVALLPLVAGSLIDAFSFPVIFIAQAIILGVGFIVSLRLKDPRSDDTGACIM